MPELIEQLSAVTPLPPGDIIFTGTAAGVAPGRDPQRWLAPGDVPATCIEGLGEMRTGSLMSYLDLQGGPLSLHGLLSVTIGVPNVAETSAYYEEFGLAPSGDGWFSTRDAGRQLRIVPALTPAAGRAAGRRRRPR